MPRDLTDKIIVITGASSGIGEATALECAGAGMHVVLNARRSERLEDLRRRIEALGREAHVVPGDVASEETTARLLDAAHGRFGGFHAVFANAGFGMDRPAVDVSDEHLREIFDVNFFASVALVRAAAQRLLEEGRPGHLLMCSSCLAKFTLPGHSAYSATKAAQNHVCRAMRIELEPHGIHVSSVHPITTATEFFDAAAGRGGGAGDTGDTGSAGDDNGERRGRSTPAHAPGLFVQSPERVARAVVKCLRKPRAEVWTSHIVRSVAAAMTLSPWFTDVIMRRAHAKDRSAAGGRER